MFFIIVLPKISCVDNIIQKSEESFLDPRTSDGNRVICEIWTERYKSFRPCHAYVASSLYPIAGSENVSRYLGSPWEQECRTRTFSDQSSTITNYTSTHPQSHTKTKINSPIPDRFTSTCANRIGTTVTAAACDSARPGLTRSGMTTNPVYSASHAIIRACRAKDLATLTASLAMWIPYLHGATEGHCVCWAALSGRCSPRNGSTGWP